MVGCPYCGRIMEWIMSSGWACPAHGLIYRQERKR